MIKDDPVIIGAGLSGLACALTLQRRGFKPLILEASAIAGGRVRTDVVEGFFLDRGFQVYLDSYPAGRRFFREEALDLHGFRHGAMIRAQGSFFRICDPWREPGSFLETFFSSLILFKDKVRLQTFLFKIFFGNFQKIERLSTLQLLKDAGFSALFIERFWKPFYGGVFLEEELSTPAEFFLFTLKQFATGTATLPAGGMGALPAQLAAQLAPESLRLDSPVAQIAPGRVELESGESIQASKIVVATDGREACRLLGIKSSPAFKKTICVYFTAPAPPHDEPILMLNAEKGGWIQTLSIQTNIAPTYSMGRKPLICISIIKDYPGDDVALEHELREECSGWFGKQVGMWRLLKIYRIPYALPEMGFRAKISPILAEKEKAGIYTCGDWIETPSINGALHSGALIADRVTADLQQMQGG